MSRLKKRVLIGTSFVIIILIGVAAFFYRPTRQALERAETLQFRRMLVTQQGDHDGYRFFFVTNRGMGKSEGPEEERFDSQRQESLRFGLFDTEIEPSLGIGMLVNPTDWFQNEEIQFKQVKQLQQADFVEQVRKQVEASPYRSLLIKVNGFREQFPSALRKTAFLSHVLDIDSPVMVFDWPGDQGSGPRGYRRAQRIATESGVELARTLQLIINQIQPDRIWLVANSMGAQVVVHGFNILFQDSALADAETEIEKVVLTAPDVDRGQFNEQFKKEIMALSNNLTVYVSSNDRALLISRIVNRAKRLGESTLDPRNPEQLEEASEILELLEPGKEIVTLIDVTPINRTRNFHNFSLETPEFFDDLYLRLINEQMPRSRPEYPVKTIDGRLYWVLTRGR